MKIFAVYDEDCDEPLYFQNQEIALGYCLHKITEEDKKAIDGIHSSRVKLFQMFLDCQYDELQQRLNLEYNNYFFVCTKEVILTTRYSRDDMQKYIEKEIEKGNVIYD